MPVLYQNPLYFKTTRKGIDAFFNLKLLCTSQKTPIMQITVSLAASKFQFMSHLSNLSTTQKI